MFRGRAPTSGFFTDGNEASNEGGVIKELDGGFHGACKDTRDTAGNARLEGGTNRALTAWENAGDQM
jgi:hypothetical protein